MNFPLKVVLQNVGADLGLPATEMRGHCYGMCNDNEGLVQCDDAHTDHESQM